MIVMKFGGTSVESAQALERVSSIVAGRLDRKPLVVVSAMGKTTDWLVAMARAVAANDLPTALAELKKMAEHHLREALPAAAEDRRAGLEAFLKGNFEHIEKKLRAYPLGQRLTPGEMDLLLSFGERLSSVIVAEAFNRRGFHAVGIDSRTAMITDASHGAAQLLPGETAAAFAEHVAPHTEHSVVVMGGFIASTVEGTTTTFGRGGSDYSAAIAGAMLGAEEVQIWTDVDGVMTADPSLVSDAHRLKVMSFGEASELAYFGAKVLHPATMAPALEKNIPIRVLNSRRPENEGTLIVAEAPHSALVKSIAYKEGITIVDVRSTRMLMAHGFLARLFAAFERFKTPVDMVATSEVSVSLTVDGTDRLDEIIAELQGVAEVERRDNNAIVCVVGDGIRTTPGVSAKIFSALDGILIKMISVGASRRNISFVVDEKDLEEVVRRLHQAFFSDIDKEVFA
jgi:aspartate kinase